MTSETKPTKIEIVRGEEGKRLIAIIESGADTPKIDRDWIAERLRQCGFAGARVFDHGAISLQRLVASKQSGRVELGECIDAEIKIQVAKDRLSAKAILMAAQGGHPATAEQMREVLLGIGILENFLDQQAIDRLLAAAKTAPPGATLTETIAIGKAPVHGCDSQFEPLIELTDRRPRLRDDDTLDYLDLGEIPTVTAGDLLMRRLPPTAGVNGMDVTGKIVEAKDGKPRNFACGKGVQVSPADPDLLVAKITGQPAIDARGASVDPILNVQDVNVRTGHITYDGTLVVRGTVHPGMRIEVSGDVRIYGMAESAEIQAGGNVEVKMGIVGPGENHPQAGEYRMLVRCAGNLSAAYIENADIEVSGDLRVRSLIAHSRVHCRNRIVVGSSGEPKSGIVGGEVNAGISIRTESLGALSSTRTRVTIVCDPELVKQYESLSQLLERKRTDLGKLLGLMVSKAKDGKTPEGDHQLRRLNETCDAMKLEIRALNEQRAQLQEAIDRATQGLIEINGTVFSGVTVGFVGQTADVRQQTDKTLFCYRDGKIRMQSLREAKKVKATEGTPGMVS